MAKAKGFSEKDKRLFIVFLFFVEVFLSYFLLIDPRLGELKRKEGELGAAKNELTSIDELLPLKNASASIKTTAFLVLPADQGAIIFQDRMAAMAKAAGNDLLGVETAVEANGRYQCSLALSGSYASLLAFIDQLEKPPFLMGVKKIRLSSTDSQRPNALNGQIELSFVLGKAEATPSTPIP